MLEVNLWDEEFRHTLKNDGIDTASYLIKPTKIKYNRDNYIWNGISVFTNKDLDLVNQVQSPIKVAWMVEARSILPKTFDCLLELEDKFDYILTWYEDLLERNPKKYKRIVTGSTRIPEPDRKIYEKTKLCSLLVTRQMSTEAHRFRHQLAGLLENTSMGVDIYGPNHLPYPTKLVAHKDYMFSIVIMNSCENFFFTEYLIDCFMCGTIPIFYGCPKLGEFFNMEGILHFTRFEEIFTLLPTITPELYLSKLEAVKDNFQRAQKYISTDDMLADILLKIAV
jgi:hypothetical protein